MKKIVIVEDERAYLKLLHEQLAMSGYQVIEAVDGEAGLAVIKKEKPDLVLLDLRLPKMDGMTMLDLLRNDESGKTVKVIILTNLEPTDRILKKVIEDLPLYYYVKSDIQLNELLKKIQELLTE